MSKTLNKVTAQISQREDGKFSLKVVQEIEGGKSVVCGMSAPHDTHEEAVKHGAAQVARLLMPVQYSDEPLDLELEMAE